VANVTFDGPNKLVVVDNGITELNCQVDLYSDWKEWMLVGDNAKYLPAFRAVGGDTLVDPQEISPYFFLLNGWRVRPYEGSHMLTVEGNLFVDGGGNPFIPTVGSYNVLVNLQTSVNAVTSFLSSGSAGGTLTAEEHDQLMALPLDAVELATVLESSMTIGEALRLFLSVLSGKSSGGGTNTIVFRDVVDGKDRITATVDANGNRTAVVRDGS
jgi:hypothetical protein